MFKVFKKYLLEKNALTDDELEMIESASVVKKLRKKQYLYRKVMFGSTMFLFVKEV